MTYRRIDRRINRRTDHRTDRMTYGCMNRRTDRRMYYRTNHRTDCKAFKQSTRTLYLILPSCCHQCKIGHHFVTMITGNKLNLLQQ